jgi:hypothetical protein
LANWAIKTNNDAAPKSWEVFVVREMSGMQREQTVSKQPGRAVGGNDMVRMMAPLRDKMCNILTLSITTINLRRIRIRNCRWKTVSALSAWPI